MPLITTFRPDKLEPRAKQREGRSDHVITIGHARLGLEQPPSDCAGQAGPQRSEEELDRRNTIERLAEGPSPCATSASFDTPTPDEPRRVGSDAEAPREPKRAQRSAPDLLRPFRQQPGVEHASSGRSLRSPVEACSFLPDRTVRPFGISSLVVQLRLLHLVLPNGFVSWSQVLTDWHVCGALAKTKLPASLASQPELAAPFVAEVGRAMRLQQLDRQSIRTTLVRERIVEPIYDAVGGPEYVAVRNAMEQSQDRYISFWRNEAKSADINVARSEMERLQAGYFAIRQRHTPRIEQAQSEALRRYWSLKPGRGLGDNFFGDCAADSIPALISRVEPAWWWREFFLCLQHRCQRFHAADGVFLDQLPGIRARVSVKKLSAEVAEWSKGMSDRWGWDGPGHYRMLADRAAAKARKLLEWYETCAPGYLTDEDVRGSLHSRLVSLLESRDPWKPLVSGRMIESEHWRN